MGTGSWHQDWVPFAASWDLDERLDSYRWEKWWAMKDIHRHSPSREPKFQLPLLCLIENRACCHRQILSVPFLWPSQQGPSFTPPSNCMISWWGTSLCSPGTGMQGWLKLWWHPLSQPFAAHLHQQQPEPSEPAWGDTNPCNPCPGQSWLSTELCC